MRKKLTYIFVAVFITLLSLNSVVYYFSFKNALETKVEEKANIVAEHIKKDIDRSIDGKMYIDDLLSMSLRQSSIAVLHKLDPDYKNVTVQQLQEIKTELGLSGITLLAKMDSDIVGVVATDEKEQGMSTKDWKYWFVAFNQLFDYKTVSVKEGQKSTNYWSGPIDFADTDATKRYKYGYYYDGSTNYIINPYIQDTYIQNYDAITGTENIVKSEIDDTGVLEVTGFNPRTFGHPPIIYKDTNGTDAISIYDKDIIFGDYVYQNSDVDSSYIEQAVSKNVESFYLDNLNGRDVIKFFKPVVLNQPEVLGNKTTYVIGIVYDYNEIKSELNTMTFRSSMIILLSLIVSIVLLYLFFRLLRRTEEQAVKVTSEQYINDINKMFTAVKGQQHDLNNHINTINALVTLEKYNDLRLYLNEYIDEVSLLNDIIQINHPILAAQIQSKMTLAFNKKIKFEHEFLTIDDTKLTAVRSIDIVRIIGNLVDNAFDEVLKLDYENRFVSLKAWTNKDQLHLCVLNNIEHQISKENVQSMFESGYTTKDGHHRGLGLSIVSDIVDKYKGKINTYTQDSMIEINIVIPMG
ncbi:sensor histidine kinase [Paenibacillus periandrae]|uniref:sensor histidine kinase n=1 Tax=Paenibacillus periandrae TaxID=1761741 RepID=UPI001F09C0C1|nr:GHKL domain-containing protein [Paenibacillus periandrae]